MEKDSGINTSSPAHTSARMVLDLDPTAYPYGFLAARMLGSGITFASVLAIGHYLGGSIGLSNAYPVRSRLFGSAVVVIASIYCRQVSIAVEKLSLDGTNYKRTKSFTLIDEARILFLKTYGIEGEISENILAGTLGFFLFLLLGGSAWRILPSDVEKPGAYHEWAGSCNACENYATRKTRDSIKQMGKIHGCHSCGFRKSPIYIADHQPPKGLVNMSYRTKFVKWLRKHEFSKLLQLSDSIGIPIKYRFFPQCRDCSQVQAIAVKERVQRNRNTKPPRFIYHAHRFRLYKLTGFALAFLTTFATAI
mmetsp:Transcript_22073/g.26928  ORF Transcript_22073/g.26928 Transcript_22073/m.26928 type:complete len:307 (+) Transcript_22073:57-977(+)